MSNTKQVIVMRTKYPDGTGKTTGLRKGKMIAQGSHASMAFLSRRVMEVRNNSIFFRTVQLTQAMEEWLDDSYAKVCCQVETEEELVEIYDKAKQAGLEVHMITDSGRTEFRGEPTKTCLAIGPDYSENIDPVTSHLKLW